jgi:hypothetical protein
VTVAANTALVCQCLPDSLTQGNADIFNRVMRINMQVALRLDIEIYHAVTRHLVQHVVQKWQTGVERRFTNAIEVNGDTDLRLEGIAIHCSLPL